MSFLSLVFRNLFRQRMRTALTVVGISMGITIVVALGAVTGGLKDTAGAMLKEGGADFIVARKGSADLTFSTVSLEEWEQVASLPEVERATGVLMHVTRYGSNPYFPLLGVRPDELAAAPPALVAGRLPRAPNEVILGARATPRIERCGSPPWRPSAMSDAPAIECVGVVKTYESGRIHALDGMDLHVDRGELVAVAGPSGCGKSTLLHLVAALDRPDSGSIQVAGHDLARERNLDHYRARHVGIVFQLHNLLPTLNAIENVQVPMFELGVHAHERRERAAELLALVELRDRERSRPAQLSGGERQRVAIARALANDPSILLADEPTGSLDSRAGRNVLDLLARIREERETTLVIVTHDTDVAARADRIVTMLDGRVDPGSVRRSRPALAVGGL